MISLLILTALLGGDEPKPVTPAAQVVQIVCKSDAMVRGNDIVLSDLAEVRTGDASLALRIETISFGQRPGFGFNRVLSARDILQRLVQEGLRAEQLSFSGAKDVVIQPLVNLVQPAELVAIAEPVLDAAIALEAGEIERELVSAPRALRTAPGRRSFEIKPVLRGGVLHSNSAIIDLKICVDEQVCETIPIQYRLRRYLNVLVANQVVPRGSALGDHNLSVRRVEAQGQASPFLANLDQLAGKVAARELRSGDRLTIAALADPAVVFRGDPVTLVAGQGRVAVSSKGIAQQDGYVGARIAVTNLTSGKVVQAVVFAPGVVVIGGMLPQAVAR